jgi:hypothetical protein
MNRAGFLWVFPCVCLLGGCEKKPTDGLVDPNPGNAVAPTGQALVVYDDVLKTGGGMGLFPSNENQQIALDSTDGPHSGRRCIRYSWNGQDIPNPGTVPNPEHTFAGFDLVVSNDLTTLAAAPARNLSAAGYTTVTFWLRGTLSDSATLKVEAPGTGFTSTIAPSITVTSLSGGWQQFTINISTADLISVKEFFKLTFVYTQPTGTTAAGGGGTVFVDDIQYNR